MSSIFKIVSTAQWEEAKITGLVPRCSADNSASLESGAQNSCVLVNCFEDLELVCSKFFDKDDYPVALEISPESYQGLLKWQQPNEQTPWKEGKLYVDHLLADMVLSVYGFEPVKSDGNTTFRLLGED
jgi:uncharacterized protein (DUF952 family)